MSVSLDNGLKYGSYEGYDYLYGTRVMLPVDEVVRSFPFELTIGRRVDVIQDSEMGIIYASPREECLRVSIELLEHIRKEYRNGCHVWFEFNNARDFLTYLSLQANNVRLFIDKRKNKYYARFSGQGNTTLYEFAHSVDARTALDLDDNSMLFEVKRDKEEYKVEKENRIGTDCFCVYSDTLEWV